MISLRGPSLPLRHYGTEYLAIAAIMATVIGTGIAAYGQYQQAPAAVGGLRVRLSADLTPRRLFLMPWLALWRLRLGIALRIPSGFTDVFEFEARLDIVFVLGSNVTTTRLWVSIANRIVSARR
jgi:hypothetical protein